MQASLSELDALLAKPEKPAQTSPLLDLDSLLAESIASRDAAAQVKADRERLKKGRMSREEADDTLARIRQWEARNEWKPLATAAVFEHTTCECGYYSEVFSHLMHRQKHKHSAGLTRLVMADTILEGLPKETIIQHFSVTICAECAKEKGWDTEHPAEEWEA